MERRQRQSVRPKAPRPAPEIREHRRAVDALECEVATAHVDNLRRGIPAIADVSHDRDLALGHLAAAVAAQDARFVAREDVRVLATREKRPGQRASRWNSTIRPCSQPYVAMESADSIRPGYAPSIVEVPLD